MKCEIGDRFGLVTKEGLCAHLIAQGLVLLSYLLGECLRVGLFTPNVSSIDGGLDSLLPVVVGAEVANDVVVGFWF